MCRRAPAWFASYRIAIRALSSPPWPTLRPDLPCGAHGLPLLALHVSLSIFISLYVSFSLRVLISLTSSAS